jgi:hypothetical protein
MYCRGVQEKRVNIKIETVSKKMCYKSIIIKIFNMLSEDQEFRSFTQKFKIK